MVRKNRKLRSAAAWVGLWVTVSGTLSVPVDAQLLKSIPPTATTDKYGNARPTYIERRDVGSFQNELQRTQTRGYQDIARRTNRRGGVTPFALPGDFLRSLPGQFPGNRYTPATTLFGVDRTIAQKYYGGFGPRKRAAEPGGMATVLQRREALISATSLNAPLHRATSMLGGFGTLKSELGQTPYLKSNSPPLAVAEMTVEQKLRVGVDVARDRVQREAWDWFRTGQYRRAASAFETAIHLDPTDTRSRIGEMFAYVSLGATRTAQVVLRSLNRQTTEPFLDDLRMLDSFRDAREARRVRTQVALLVGRDVENAERNALQALALWYVGSREEARAIVQRLARDTRDQRYTIWLSSMQSTTTSEPADRRRP